VEDGGEGSTEKRVKKSDPDVPESEHLPPPKTRGTFVV